MSVAGHGQEFDPMGPRPRSLWGQQVFNAALELLERARLAEPDDPTAAEVASRVNGLILAALELAARRPLRPSPHRLGEWWTGSRVETCWAYLHAAEIELAAVESPRLHFANVRSALFHSHRLPPDDVDRLTLEAVAAESVAESVAAGPGPEPLR